MERIKGLAYVLCALIGSVHIDIWHDNYKFLATKATGEVTATALFRESECQCL